MSEKNEIAYSVWEVPSGKWTVKKKFVGVWRITELKEYDADYVDLCGPAKVKISTRGTGQINFGAIEAEIDCKMDELDERVLRLSFEGEDEGDHFIGRGYCLVEGDDMTGRLFRHFGDQFSFRATRTKKTDETGA
jgi:hypothetical protein